MAKRGQIYRYHVFLVVLSFAFLWLQAFRLTTTFRAIEQKTDRVLLITATEVVFYYDAPQVLTIGKIAWGIVLFGFSTGGLAAYRNYRLRCKKKYVGITAKQLRGRRVETKELPENQLIIYQKYGNTVYQPGRSTNTTSSNRRGSIEIRR